MQKPTLIAIALASTIGLLGTAYASITPQTPSSWPGNGISQYQPGLSLRGFNLSGAEFQPSATGQYDMNNFPSIEDTIYFAYKGENVVRLPFAWEYLQPGLPSSNASIDWTSKYASSYLQLISNLTNQGITVIVDMHDYMRYETNLANYSNNSNPSDESIIDTTGEPTSAQFSGAWASITQAIDANLTPAQSKLVMFELMNEPHNMNKPLLSTKHMGPQAVLDLENAAIKAIRQQENQDNASAHMILLDADWYTGMHTWTQPTPDYARSPSNASVFTTANIIDRSNNYALDVHQYMDSDFSGTHNDCLDNQTFVSDLNEANFINAIKAQGLKVFLGEFGAGTGANCEADIHTLLSFVNQNQYNNQYGFIGFSAWSTGHSWGDYLLNMSPGGPANIWMTTSDTLPTFLTQAAPLPALGQEIVSLVNNTPYPLSFASSNGYFQTSTPGDLQPGATAYIYKSPDGAVHLQSQITYKTTLANSAGASQVVYYGFGVTADPGDYAFVYPADPSNNPVPFVEKIDASGQKYCAIFTGSNSDRAYTLETANCPSS